MRFIPCAGREACTEDGTHCRGCGRSHDEIARARELVDALAAFALQWGYDNAGECFEYIAHRALKKLASGQMAGHAAI